MKHFRIFSGILFFTLLMVLGCSRETQQISHISEPFEKVKIPFQQFSINAEKDTILNFPTGTKITIPANALVTENGEKATGNVEINFREFHSPAEIITSGISMKFKENGQEKDFESAGMFELTGSQGGKPVYIEEGKKVTVTLASYQTESSYNFYFLDQEGEGWAEMGTGDPIVNTAKKEKVESLPDLPSKPFLPGEPDVNATVVDLDVNYNHFPELKAFNDIMWQIESGATAGLFTKNYSDIKLSSLNPEEGLYKLTLTHKKSETEVMVRPVLKGKSLEKATALYNEKMKDYDNALQKRKLEEDLLRKEANMLRTFKVANFGIYNWDKFIKNDDYLAIKAKFEFNGEVDPEKISIFLVPGNSNAAVKYQYKDWGFFSFNPKLDNKILAILPGDQVAFFGTEDFKNVDITRIKNSEEYTFTLKTRPAKINGVGDLQKILQDI